MTKLSEFLERPIAPWYRIYAKPINGKFTLDSDVCDETDYQALYFSTKGFFDSMPGTVQEKIEQINSRIDKALQTL